MNRRAFLAVSPFLSIRALAANSSIAFPGEDGRLVYVPDALGNTIPDFSNCGYQGGGASIPDVAEAAVVEPTEGDATDAIQSAINSVAGLPANESGFRGAVLIKSGTYRIGGVIRIAQSGIVLRGEGQGEDGTVLLGTGTRQRNLVEVRGRSAGRAVSIGATITDDYVPVGARSFHVASAERLTPGMNVLVRRAGNAAWISEIAMDRITPSPTDPASTVQWTPFNLDFDRIVTSVEADLVTVDAPIVCAIEQRWGGGQVLLLQDVDRVEQVGIELLRGDSEFDRSKTATISGQRYFSDEAHAWSFLSIDLATNVWVRQLTGIHFGYACVDVDRGKWVTVEDCECLDMISQITGSRRYCFDLNGQLCLIQRCSADTGRHDFVVGSRVPGPNVFLHCTSGRMFATSEPHHRWSVGGLYDNVKANIAIQDRQNYGTGHGWAGANYVVWNCEGTLVCQSPPTAQNWAIGHVGRKVRGAFEPKPDGIWESLGTHVEPESLYLHQLRDRLQMR
ncbi:MAG: hypothetical protein HY820_38095 [Acidobacteria bacterium]|nr:hypothetical protein [Acidobacteriota bacterium]